mmetsp:Transcript_26816/g.58897  ORF Transcript_26816/g.58897 Transcript_26816/m.58897 type:complete len:212 (+) Transcript_26816:225-860(+)
MLVRVGLKPRQTISKVHSNDRSSSGSPARGFRRSLLSRHAAPSNSFPASSTMHPTGHAFTRIAMESSVTEEAIWEHEVGRFAARWPRMRTRGSARIEPLSGARFTSLRVAYRHRSYSSRWTRHPGGMWASDGSAQVMRHVARVGVGSRQSWRKRAVSSLAPCGAEDATHLDRSRPTQRVRTGTSRSGQKVSGIGYGTYVGTTVQAKSGCAS